MDEALSNVNWLVTGIVGVSTSIIGAFLYSLFGKLGAKYSDQRRGVRLEKLQAEIDRLYELSSSDTNLTIYCFRNLFYILALSALASAVSFFNILDFLFGSVLSVSLWISIFLIGWQAFSTLSKLSKFDIHEKEVKKEIEQLTKLQGATKN
ncbi:TPA: hypothetical protein ACX6Q0_000845 [Photobacterium damselae]